MDVAKEQIVGFQAPVREPAASPNHPVETFGIDTYGSMSTVYPHTHTHAQDQKSGTFLADDAIAGQSPQEQFNLKEEGHSLHDRAPPLLGPHGQTPPRVLWSLCAFRKGMFGFRLSKVPPELFPLKA